MTIIYAISEPVSEGPAQAVLSPRASPGPWSKGMFSILVFSKVGLYSYHRNFHVADSQRTFVELTSLRKGQVCSCIYALSGPHKVGAGAKGKRSLNTPEANPPAVVWEAPLVPSSLTRGAPLSPALSKHCWVVQGHSLPSSFHTPFTFYSFEILLLYTVAIVSCLLWLLLCSSCLPSLIGKFLRTRVSSPQSATLRQHSN